MHFTLHLCSYLFVFGASTGVQDVNSDACTVLCTLRRRDLTSSCPRHWHRDHWTATQKKGFLFIIIRLENECSLVVAVYLHRSCKIIFGFFVLGFLSYAEVRAERRRDLGLEESSIELASSSLKVPCSFTVKWGDVWTKLSNSLPIVGKYLFFLLHFLYSHLIPSLELGHDSGRP